MSRHCTRGGSLGFEVLQSVCEASAGFHDGIIDCIVRQPVSDFKTFLKKTKLNEQSSLGSHNKLNTFQAIYPRWRQLQLLADLGKSRDAAFTTRLLSTSLDICTPLLEFTLAQTDGLHQPTVAAVLGIITNYTRVTADKHGLRAAILDLFNRQAELFLKNGLHMELLDLLMSLPNCRQNGMSLVEAAFEASVAVDCQNKSNMHVNDLLDLVGEVAS
jgi:hypothetical protein